MYYLLLLLQQPHGVFSVAVPASVNPYQAVVVVKFFAAIIGRHGCSSGAWAAETCALETLKCATDITCLCSEYLVNSNSILLLLCIAVQTYHTSYLIERPFRRNLASYAIMLFLSLIIQLRIHYSHIGHLRFCGRRAT